MAHSEPSEQLRFFQSPFRPLQPGADDDVPSLAKRNPNSFEVKHQVTSHEQPLTVVRHSEPTLLEVFFDLFFAATFDIFSDSQTITDGDRFKAYMGYFSLLWMTWLVVTLFDVRYVTDGVFSRMIRAAQLGVQLGFAIVAPKFTPETQDAKTMRAVSLTLMASRVFLAIDYGVVVWHSRRCKSYRKPLALQICIHLAAAAIYLGISFRFSSGRNSRVYTAWYIVSSVEVLLSLALSNMSPVVGLVETHLVKRLALFTGLIIGDGIVKVAKDVVTIDKNPYAWSLTTIGLVTAAAAALYFVFLVYFDWLQSTAHLSSLRHQMWTIVHLPLHLCLVTFVQGFTQIILWSKVSEVTEKIGITFSYRFEQSGKQRSLDVASQINASTVEFFRQYPPTIPGTFATVDQAIANISQLPDSVWAAVDLMDTTDGLLLDLESIDAAVRAKALFFELISAQINTLYTTYGIKLGEGLAKLKARLESDSSVFDDQTLLHPRRANGWQLSYTTIAAGCTLFLMIVASILGRVPPRRVWPMFRLVVVCAVATGMSLLSLVFLRDDIIDFAWVLPVISGSWLFVLVITHIHGLDVWDSSPAFGRLGGFFKRGRVG